MATAPTSNQQTLRFAASVSAAAILVGIAWNNGAQRAAAAVQIENRTAATVTFQTTVNGQATSRSINLPAGRVESLSADRPVDCQFEVAGRSQRYSLQPGRTYRFVNLPNGTLALRTLAGGNGTVTASAGAASSTPAQAPPLRTWPHVREVKVILAGGKEYRTFYRGTWQARARGIVEAAAARFAEQFPIHFRVVGYRDWEYQKAPQTAGDAFEWLHKIDRESADLVIGFTMVPFPGPRGEIRGVTQYFSPCIVLPDCWGTTGATTRLVHEMCHVFGAFHVAAPDSVMQLGFERTPKHFRFGPSTEQTVELCKDVDLRVGVESLSAGVQQQLREIYRQHHHPAESVDEDPVVVAYRYEARRSGWSGDTERSKRMQAVADELAPHAAEPRPALDQE